MPTSEIKLKGAPPLEVLRDVERHARLLLTSTRSLVSALADADIEELRMQAASDRGRFEHLLNRTRSDPVVTSQARTLLECLHEAALEFDLAVTLGFQDPCAIDAAERANVAVTQEGRALLRTLELLVEDVRIRSQPARPA